jgi:hypothetical protein
MEKGERVGGEERGGGGGLGEGMREGDVSRFRRSKMTPHQKLEGDVGGCGSEKRVRR